jgi:MauM/NapG family ferredoxin protein
VLSSIRKSRWSAQPWTTLRKVVQILALVLFLVFFVGSHAGRISGGLASLPFRLDPLIALSNLLASRAFLAGSALALITLGITLLAGRVWCGWLCPLGTLLDLFSLRRWRQRRWGLPDSLRQIKYVLLLLILFAAIFTNLTLLVLDPLTLLTRTLTVSVWPGLDHVVTSLEAALYQIPFLRPVVSSFDPWVRPSIFPPIPHAYQGAVLFGGIFVALIGLNLLAERFWCRYLCPLGGMLGLLSKGALLRRSVTSECTHCGLCADSCPTGTIDPSTGYKSDPGECTMCMECLYGCQFGSTTFIPQIGVAPRHDYDPDRRKALMAFGAAVAGAALLRVDLAGDRSRPHLLRPPGVIEDEFLSTCIRCGQCIRTCPSGALQPALMEAGIEGMWTPLLVPRMGYCDYSCNACGLSCPVEAIPPLSLEEKRVQMMGKASVDRNRCLAWAEDTPCIVCEEMCPLPEKAIVLEEAEVLDAEGHPILLQRPKVIAERCIGCGICEYKCPVQGEAAIRVFVGGSESGIFG